MNVTDALTQRKTIRAFLGKPVSTALVESLVAKAHRAPSGGNVQPWKVVAVAGAQKDALSTLAFETLLTNPDGEEGDFPIYPPKLSEPYRSRRFEIGEMLYGQIGIPREDKAARRQQLAKNYAFFGAPVALFLVIDRAMGHGQWAHMGMFMQSFALAAEEAGLGTCMQEAWARVRESVRTALGIDEDHVVYCAIALGYPDLEDPINQMTSPRAPLDEILTLKGFED